VKQCGLGLAYEGLKVQRKVPKMAELWAKAKYEHSEGTKCCNEGSK